ncbi:hypothetical protein PCASD_09527 [Puccinia coronata f. sp. avenae]|uniref:Uncharacterized protein n=1 Tax=Puccinia coronata f. sp. avenae TaxID=200324 RepID=A0A2N5U677_9BASI|nr:hypothetical protein PCASD_09527 [Puccinia coronata f. sp. avenae]
MGAVSTLNRLVSLVATTSASLTADRACLCLLLISKLLDFVETPVVHLQDSLANQPDTTLRLSFCIRALRLWSLYIPDIPIDPLSVQTANHSYLQAWASRLCQLREFLVLHQAKDVRLPSNAPVSQLNEEIAAIQLQCNRSRSPQSSALPIRLSNTQSSPSSKHLKNNFLRMVASKVYSVISLTQFLFSAIGLIHPLTKRFPTSVDILWPIQAFLNTMIADLTLTFQRAVARLSNPSTRVIADFIGLLTTTTTAVAAANLRENVNLERAQAAITDEASQSSMSLLCISAMSKYSNDEIDDSQTLKLLSFYDKMWNLWTRDCIRQQKEAEEKAQEFKTRRQDIIIKSDEEIEEEKLRALFPFHEDNTPRSSPNSSANLITPAQISILCEMHLSMMSGEVDQAHSTSSVLLFVSASQNI